MKRKIWQTHRSFLAPGPERLGDGKETGRNWEAFGCAVRGTLAVSENRRALMRLFVKLMVAVTAVFSGVAFAAKPAPPPPPPSGCAAAGGTFPSIVFGRRVFATSGALTSWDIYVGNSLGTCAVKVYSIPGTSANNVSMSFNDPQGRIVWVQSERPGKNQPARGVVKMVKFQVVNQAIAEPLPLLATNVYQDPLDTTGATLYDANISSGGDAVVITRQVSTRVELKLLDVATCVSACLDSTPFSDIPYDGISGAVFGPDGTDRIYFTAKRSGTGSAWGVYLLERATSAWIGPRLVASMADLHYSDPTRKIFMPSTTRVAGDSVLLSFSWFAPSSYTKGVDVLNVTYCNSSGNGSCLEEGENPGVRIVNQNIPGQEGSGGWKDGSLLQMIYTGTLDGRIEATDPVTQEVLVSHGPGVLPDGVK
jgi:hypothetical protein